MATAVHYQRMPPGVADAWEDKLRKQAWLVVLLRRKKPLLSAKLRSEVSDDRGLVRGTLLGLRRKRGSGVEGVERQRLCASSGAVRQ